MSSAPDPTESAIYEGWIRHRRFSPVAHEFRYRIFMPYLNLDDLPDSLDSFPLWSARRKAPAVFRRSDFIGDQDVPLAEHARNLVEESTGARPAGSVCMLANLRYFGHIFNPVAFYYCHGASKEVTEAVIASVKSIPWGEQHPYVLARGGRTGPVLSDEMPKALHVSPLMGMDQNYGFRATEPGSELIVHIDSRDGETDELTFDSTLTLERKPMTRASMSRVLARHPAMTMQVVGRIYAQALRLKLKGARSFPHPHDARPKPRGLISP